MAGISARKLLRQRLRRRHAGRGERRERRQRLSSAPSDLACASSAANGAPLSTASRNAAALKASRAALSAVALLAMSSRAALADCSSAAMRFCKASSSAGDIPADVAFRGVLHARPQFRHRFGRGIGALARFRCALAAASSVRG